MTSNSVNWADEPSSDLAPPDLGPLRAMAERAELAEAVSMLAGADGYRLPGDRPPAPLARDLARSLTEAGFTLHHCMRHDPLYRLGGVCLLPVTARHDDGNCAESWCPGPRMIFCCATGPAMAPTVPFKR